MATFTLVVRPDGRALLTTTQRLSDEMREHILEHLRVWRDGNWPVALVEDCAVVQVAEIDVDLGPAEAVS